MDSNMNIFSLYVLYLETESHRIKSTYLAFLDAEKTFDHVDRDLLRYKLLRIGIKCDIYESIKNIYKILYCSVNVDNMLTDWLNTKAGVKQGDSFSPTMFGIYINDIVEDVKSVQA